MKVHLWVPGVAPESGGIEKYSSFLLNALGDCFGSAAVTVLAKNDRGKAESVKSEVACTGRVPLRLRTGTFSVLAATRALLDRPDLIITTHLNFSPLARWLKHCAGIHYWVSLHGIEAWGLENVSRKRGLAEAELLLPVSSYTRDVVAREQGITPDRFRVLPNAFEPADFQIGPKPGYLLKRYGLAPDQPVILTVGRLSTAERYKGQDRVLRVLRDVAEPTRSAECGTRNLGVQGQMGNPQSAIHHSSARYVIAGDGDDRPRLEKLAEELGVRELVIFAGKVPTEELCDHYNLCDLFAMPSTGEGFGIVFLEALACGKPVIAGNKDASRDALLDGQLGVLVDPDNLQELTEALVAVLAEVERRRAKGESQTSTFRDGKPGLASGCVTARSAIRISPVIFQPEALRAKVIEHFGYDKFKETLAGYLEELTQMRKAEGEARKLNI